MQVWHCALEKKFFPSPKYCMVNCLPGLALGGAGVFCLLFLETGANHQYVHSAWHLAMGVALLLLLPVTKVEQEGEMMLMLMMMMIFLLMLLMMIGKRMRLLILLLIYF